MGRMRCDFRAASSASRCQGVPTLQCSKSDKLWIPTEITHFDLCSIRHCCTALRIHTEPMLGLCTHLQAYIKACIAAETSICAWQQHSFRNLPLISLAFWPAILTNLPSGCCILQL